MRLIFSLIILLTSSAPAHAAGVVKGIVAIAPELSTQVRATDTLFIFAQAPKGPKMPLAVVRKPAKKLPFSFTLDDSMAMMPAMKISNFPEVRLIARISRSGLARPSSGDLQGSVERVKVGGKAEVKLVIDSVVQ